MTDLPKETIRFSELPARNRRGFNLTPDAAQCSAIAETLGILGLRKLRFQGQLTPLGKKDWRLEAHLGATVTQACVVSLAPVVTRIDDDIERAYLADMDPPEGAEVEMPEDDATDPLPAELDLAEVMIEALVLALPPYPRSEDADAQDLVFTEPGKQALRDEDLKPFAGLAGLRDTLKNKPDEAE